MGTKPVIHVEKHRSFWAGKATALWQVLETRSVPRLRPCGCGDVPAVPTPRTTQAGGPSMSTRIDIAFDPAPAADSAKNTTAGAGPPGQPDSDTGRIPMVATFGPIETVPRGLRPPYDAYDPETIYRPGERAEHLSERVRAARRAALLEPLDGLGLGDFEGPILDWLAGWDDSTVAVVVAWLHRARAAGPLVEGGHGPAGGER